MVPPPPTSTAIPGVPPGSCVPGTNYQGAAGDRDGMGSKATTSSQARSQRQARNRAHDRPSCNVSPQSIHDRELDMRLYLQQSSGETYGPQG